MAATDSRYRLPATSYLSAVRTIRSGECLATRKLSCSEVGADRCWDISFYPSELQVRPSQQIGLHQFTETGSCDLIDSVPSASWRFPTLPAQRVPRLEPSLCSTSSWCSRWRDAVSPESLPQGFRERTGCCLIPRAACQPCFNRWKNTREISSPNKSYCWLLGNDKRYHVPIWR